MSVTLEQAVALLEKKAPLGDQLKGEDLSGLKAPPGANFKDAFLRYTRFVGADLRGADFRGANLRHADFRQADLRGADFTDADVAKAYFQGAMVPGAKLCLAQNIDQADGVRQDYLFFSQESIEDLIAAAPADFSFDGKSLHAPGIQGSFGLTEAYRVLELIDGTDEENLIGQVYSRSELESKGAEVYPDSAILADAGYILQAGFLGVSAGTEVSTASVASSSAQVEEEKPRKDADKTDIDLLNDFLLGQT